MTTIMMQAFQKAGIKSTEELYREDERLAREARQEAERLRYKRDVALAALIKARKAHKPVKAIKAVFNATVQALSNNPIRR